MKNKIKNILENIEKEENIKIIFAIENGSRAWKMESKDSDYDVRFVFVRPLQEYIQINKPCDVINDFYNSDGIKDSQKDALIDISGFDIFKYMKLLANSNPTTIEWLMSDIIYYGERKESLKEYVLKNFSPLTLFHHYKSLCNNNYSDFIKNTSKVTYKKYLYAFRGLINALWVYHNKSVPSINFIETVEQSEYLLGKNVYLKLREIIELKSQGKEKDIISNIDFIDEYIENFLNTNYDNLNKNNLDIEELNKELRKIVLNS
ncbi:MAG: nucleotidyltransferase domain-containing protein [bacterium]